MSPRRVYVPSFSDETGGEIDPYHFMKIIREDIYELIGLVERQYLLPDMARSITNEIDKRLRRHREIVHEDQFLRSVRACLLRIFGTADETRYLVDEQLSEALEILNSWQEDLGSSAGSNPAIPVSKLLGDFAHQRDTSSGKSVMFSYSAKAGLLTVMSTEEFDCIAHHLTLNARKAISQSIRRTTGRITYEGTEVRENGKVFFELAVIDNGRGFTAAEMDALEDPTSFIYRGRGLRTVASIAGSYGGYLVIECCEGGGTIVRARFASWAIRHHVGGAVV